MQGLKSTLHTLRRGIPVVFVKLQILIMYKYTVRTQLCYIIRCYITYQLHVSALIWPSSCYTKLTE
jgi:hypothetical protein